MKRSGLIATALLAGAALLFVGEAFAQPRESAPRWEDPVGPPTPSDVWLKRLVGGFQFEGLVHVVAQGDCGELPPDPNNPNPPPPPPPSCQAVKGLADCIAIGTGPGVQCVLNVTWQEIYKVDAEAGTASAEPGAVPYLDPAMELFGVDPGKSAINHLLVDNKGLPEGGLGFTTGNRATFKTQCVNVPGGGACERFIRIDAKPDANLLFMTITIQNETSKDPITDITLSMRRRAPADAAKAVIRPASR